MAIIYWTEENGQSKGLTFDATISEEITQAAVPTEYPVESGGVISDHVQPQQLGYQLEAFVTNTPTVALNPTLPTDARGQQIQDAAPLTGGAVRSLPLPRATRNPVTSGNVTGDLPTVGGVRGLPSQRLVLAGTPFRERRNGNTARGAAVLQFATPPNRVFEVYDILRELLDNSRELNIITGITGANPDESGRTLESMFITNLSAPRTTASGTGVIFDLTFRQLVLVTIQFGPGRKAPTPKKRANAPKKNVGNRATGNSTGLPETLASNAEIDRYLSGERGGILPPPAT